MSENREAEAGFSEGENMVIMKFRELWTVMNVCLEL